MYLFPTCLSVCPSCRISSSRVWHHVHSVFLLVLLPASLLFLDWAVMGALPHCSLSFIAFANASSPAWNSIRLPIAVLNFFHCVLKHWMLRIVGYTTNLRYEFFSISYRFFFRVFCCKNFVVCISFFGYGGKMFSRVPLAFLTRLLVFVFNGSNLVQSTDKVFGIRLS